MSVTKSHPAPPFDPELAVLLKQWPFPPGMKIDQLIARRDLPRPSIDEIIGDRDIVREDRQVPGSAADPDITITIFSKRDHVPGGPAFYHTHGGGMVSGDRFTGMDRLFEWVELFDAVVVSVEYRLAPEHPDPAPVNDCYAGLVWTAEHAEELQFDPSRLIIVGGSAGGGLAAGVALIARDRGGPALAAQILICPMLDDRNITVSSHQFDGFGVWDRGTNESGWTALLGARRGTDDVSIYAAPARATDLSNLPPAYVDCGSAEVFRDEDVAYASALWAAGNVADLHVWAGGHHGFDGIFPSTAVSGEARRTRTDFVRRIIQQMGAAV